MNGATPQKLTFTLSEIAAQVGVSEKTVRRRMESVKELLIRDQNQQRKWFYSPDEVELIKSLFNPSIKGL